ncbi:DUF742 domain-containing protein [Streptomyces sp. NPDC001889]
MASGYEWEASTRVPRYALTGGRTTPALSLRLESQVRAHREHDAAALPPEQRQLVALCQEAAKSVIELAGTLHLPVPLVMVIISDLLTSEALVMVVPRAGNDAPREVMLDAVLTGLRRKFGVSRAAS